MTARLTARARPARPHFGLEAEHGGPVAGVDEAGRGPLAGPVLAAAVIFPRAPSPPLAALLDDSKRLDAAAREAAHDVLMAAARDGHAHVSIAAASAHEIGMLNILGATHLAMRRAVARLRVAPVLARVDGNQPPRLACETRCIIGGDGLSLSIAAASILAKVTRDRAMHRLGARHPAYGFERHAGYPTAFHRAALMLHGRCAHHRRGFRPVEAAFDHRDAAAQPVSNRNIP